MIQIFTVLSVMTSEILISSFRTVIVIVIYTIKRPYNKVE